jgi:8-oxo-dGTP pyrophosphatase MutT (NUDIX family)
MIDRFDEEARQTLATRCAAFPRIALKLDNDVSPPLKRAAVVIAVVATDDKAPGFLLTRRAPTLRSHSSQWALPGGRLDKGETPVEAALRELHEEVGLELDATAILGMLDDYPTRSGYLITPVMVWASADHPLRPNPDEVVAVYRVPFTDLAPEDAVRFSTIPESDRPLVQVRMQGSWVNAPTAAVVYQFRELLAGRDTRVAEFDQPMFARR